MISYLINLVPLNRDTLCAELFDKLGTSRAVLVRSPPYSGKTSLAKLFGIYYAKKVPVARVISLSMLVCGITHGLPLETAQKRFLKHWLDFAIDVRKSGIDLCVPLDEEWVDVIKQGRTGPTIIILDEAQILYHLGSDFLLWNAIKLAQQGGNIQFLVFAAYGEPPRDLSHISDCATPFTFNCYMGIAELRLHELECRQMLNAVGNVVLAKFLAPIPPGMYRFPLFF